MNWILCPHCWHRMAYHYTKNLFLCHNCHSAVTAEEFSRTMQVAV